MHILSELRNPLFDAPDRQRALRALQMSRILRENNSAKAWQAVKAMIDKAVSEANLSPRGPAQPPNPPYMLQNLQTTTSTLPVNTAANSNNSVYPTLQAIPNYVFQNSNVEYNPQPLPTRPHPQPQPQPQQMQPQPDILESMQDIQDRAPCWDDINLNNINNIVGDLETNPDVIPDFDFVSKPFCSCYTDKRSKVCKFD